MTSLKCQVLIIGAGPGGYVCGIRAGQLGLDTIVVESASPGGTCLNIGCIPSKALIHASDAFYRARSFSADNALGISAGHPRIDLGRTVEWKNGIVSRLTGGVSGLLKKAKTRYVQGHAKIVDGKTVDVESGDERVRITCENLVIATGSAPYELSFLPFGGNVISSTEALDLDVVPGNMTVVGGGYIGLEIGTAMAKLGSNVTVVEAADRILPQYDSALTSPIVTRLKDLGVTLHLSAKATGLSPDTTSLRVAKGDDAFEIPADKVLVAVGRKPMIHGFGLEGLGLEMKNGFISTHASGATSMRGVYAIGDVTGDPMLAHRAMAQGAIVAEHLAGRGSTWDKRAVPAVCFTDPELVVVGLLPGEAEGSDTAVFPFSANGRSMTVERSDGMVRFVYDKSSELILGIQAVGAGVSEMAGEFALAIEMAATLADVGDTIHAHPTLGETVQECALKGLSRALHI